MKLPIIVFIIFSIWVSDYQTFGLSDLRTIEPLDYRAFQLLDLGTIGPLDYRAFGLSDRHRFDMLTLNKTHLISFILSLQRKWVKRQTMVHKTSQKNRNKQTNKQTNKLIQRLSNTYVPLKGTYELRCLVPEKQFLL